MKMGPVIKRIQRAGPLTGEIGSGAREAHQLSLPERSFALTPMEINTVLLGNRQYLIR